MRFWDTSAVMPLIGRESFSARMESVLAEDEGMVVWWATRVECVSAIRRRAREGSFSQEEEEAALGWLADLSSAWSEVRPSSRLRRIAERSLALHPLRAADALQLASALVWCEDEPEGRKFVTLDRRLRSAAARLGFSLLPKTLDTFPL